MSGRALRLRPCGLLGPLRSERRTRTWRSHARSESCIDDLRRLGKPLVNPAESTPNKVALIEMRPRASTSFRRPHSSASDTSDVT